MSEKKSFEIARETLAPTPGNYKAIYNEIAGIPSVEHFPAQELRGIASVLQAKTPGQQRQKGLLDSAIDRMNWDGVRAALVAYSGFSQASSSTESGTAQVSAWSAADAAPALTSEFLSQMGRLIEYAQPALGTDDERFTEQSAQLIKALKHPGMDVIAVKLLLVNYSHRLSFAAEDQAEIKIGLLKLLQLVFENIAELSLDDQWLKGQMEALKSASAPPLTLRRLDDVERLLKDVISKQKDAKQKTLVAQDEMRQMLAAFIDRLSQMSQSTGSYQEKLEESARLIENSKSINEIAPVLKEIVVATRDIANETLLARDELQAMRKQADSTQAQIAKLHQ